MMIKTAISSFKEIEEYVLDFQRDFHDTNLFDLKYFRLPSIWAKPKGVEYEYAVAKLDKKIVGLMEMMTNDPPGSISLCYITVNPEYKNQGISKLLINEFCRYAKEVKKQVKLGDLFSEEGRSYVMKNLAHQLSHHGIEWEAENKEMMSLKNKERKPK